MLKKFTQSDDLPGLEAEVIAAVRRMLDPTIPGNDPRSGVYIDLSKEGSTCLGFFQKRLAKEEQAESLVATWLYYHMDKEGQEEYGAISPISRMKLEVVVQQLFKDCPEGVNVARENDMVEVCFPNALKDLIKKAETKCVE